jgi:hypothetical protein
MRRRAPIFGLSYQLQYGKSLNDFNIISAVCAKRSSGW